MSVGRVRRFAREGHALHGVQLVVAVAAAYGVSSLLRLPEGAWAVMSALIVTRPNADATMAAAWQRVAATLGGSLCGLAGSWLQQRQLAPPGGVMLLPVALLAFATAGRTGLRSAPIAALIVLSAAGRSDLSAIGVAMLRTLEIGVGAGVGIAVAFGAQRLHVTPRPAILMAGLLRQLADQVTQAAASEAPTHDTRSAAVRATLRRLGAMVDGSRQPQQRQLLALAVRLTQDAGWLVRIVASTAAESRAAAAQAAGAAAAALAGAAARLEGAADVPAQALAALPEAAGAAWQPDVLRLLRDDLRKLLCVTAGTARAA